MFASSFACHYNAPKFYLELEDRSPQKFLAITMGSFMFCAALFVFVAESGYARFGDHLGGKDGGNILQMYGSIEQRNRGEAPALGGTIPVALAWLGLSFSVIASFPLVYNGARGAFFRVVFGQTVEESPADLNYKV